MRTGQTRKIAPSLFFSGNNETNLRHPSVYILYGSCDIKPHRVNIAHAPTQTHLVRFKYCGSTLSLAPPHHLPSSPTSAPLPHRNNYKINNFFLFAACYARGNFALTATASCGRSRCCLIDDSNTHNPPVVRFQYITSDLSLPLQQRSRVIHGNLHIYHIPNICPCCNNVCGKFSVVGVPAYLLPAPAVLQSRRVCRGCLIYSAAFGFKFTICCVFTAFLLCVRA